MADLVNFGTQSGQPIVPGMTETLPFNAMDSDQEKAEILRLRSRHDLYDIFAPDWRVYAIAYEGGSSICTEEFVYKHQRENDLDYADRLRRLHYHNYCDVLVDFFINFIYAETIQRSGGTNDAWYQQFIDDVDLKGNDITTFMKMWERDREVYGMAFVLIDEPAITPDRPIITKADEAAFNIRPYWVLLKPDEITDWQRNDFDTLTYVKRRQLDTQILSDKRKHRLEKYTEFYPDEIVVTTVDVTDQEKLKIISKTVTHSTLGYIPIHCEVFKTSMQYPGMGNSFLRDLARNNIEILNLTSVDQEFLYRQCFNVLAKETDSSVPTFGEDDSVLSTTNVIEVPKGAAMPTYISPPADPARYISEKIAKITNEMFRRASQDTLNELFNGEGKSGFSQAQSFSKSVPFIATRADICEKAENALISLTLKRLDKSWDGKIKYKDRYELTNITDMITQLTSLARDLMMPSETFVKEELKRIVAEFDGQIPVDMRKKIEGEIDAMNFDDWTETQKEALVGTGQSPAAQQKDKSTGTMAEAAAEAKSKPAATNKLKSK